MDLIRSGLRAIRDNPALAFAEIAWRWTFGAAAWFVVVLTVRAIMAGIDISRVEAELAHTIDAVRMADAIARVLVQVLPRVVHALAFVVPLLALVWIAAATIGRFVTLRRLLDRYHRGTGVSPVPPTATAYVSLVLINALRAFFAVAAFVAFFGTVFAVSAQTAPDLASSGAAPLLVFAWLLFGLLVGMLWSIVNWFLALAPIFALRDGSHAGRAIGQSLGLYRCRSRDYLAIATWYGLFRGLALVLAIVAGCVVVAAGSVRAAVALSVAVALVYFAIADSLYIARLASYVALANDPIPAVAARAGVSPPVPRPATPYTETESEL